MPVKLLPNPRQKAAEKQEDRGRHKERNHRTDRYDRRCERDDSRSRSRHRRRSSSKKMVSLLVNQIMNAKSAEAEQRRKRETAEAQIKKLEKKKVSLEKKLAKIEERR